MDVSATDCKYICLSISHKKIYKCIVGNLIKITIPIRNYSWYKNHIFLLTSFFFVLYTSTQKKLFCSLWYDVVSIIKITWLVS